MSIERLKRYAACLDSLDTSRYGKDELLEIERLRVDIRSAIANKEGSRADALAKRTNKFLLDQTSQPIHTSDPASVKEFKPASPRDPAAVARLPGEEFVARSHGDAGAFAGGGRFEASAYPDTAQVKEIIGINPIGPRFNCISGNAISFEIPRYPSSIETLKKALQHLDSLKLPKFNLRTRCALWKYKKTIKKCIDDNNEELARSIVSSMPPEFTSLFMR
jgi:hypothetical protein